MAHIYENIHSGLSSSRCAKSILVIAGHYLFGVEMEGVEDWVVIFSP